MRAARERARALSAHAETNANASVESALSALQKPRVVALVRATPKKKVMRVESRKTREARLEKYKVPAKPVPDVAPPEELYDAGMSLGAPGVPCQERALFFVTYLTAGRVSEVLELVRLKADIEHLPNENSWVFSLVTEKRGDRFIRQVSVPTLPGSVEEKMMREVVAWMNCVAPGAPLFSLSRTNVVHYFHRAIIHVRANHPNFSKEDRAVIREFRVHPHYLRHCRLTHLVSRYGLTDSDLRQITGWKTNELAATYVQLKSDDIRRKMLRQAGG